MTTRLCRLGLLAIALIAAASMAADHRRAVLAAVVAAIDPCRSRWATVFTVICRFGGFAFFAIVGGPPQKVLASGSFRNG